MKRALVFNVTFSFVLFFVSLISVVQLAMVSPALAMNGWMSVAIALWNIVIAMALAQMAYDLYSKHEESKNT